jgi:hypothetical protein
MVGVMRRVIVESSVIDEVTEDDKLYLVNKPTTISIKFEGGKLKEAINLIVEKINELAKEQEEDPEYFGEMINAMIRGDPSYNDEFIDEEE